MRKVCVVLTARPSWAKLAPVCRALQDAPGIDLQLVVCADRHEVLAAAAAARMLEIPVCHLQGGERSGSVDDDIRDSITALSSLHCVANPTKSFEAALSQFVHDIHAKTE